MNDKISLKFFIDDKIIYTYLKTPINGNSLNNT